MDWDAVLRSEKPITAFVGKLQSSSGRSYAMCAGNKEELLLPPKARGVWGRFSALFIRKRGSEICSGTKADGLERLKTPVETSLWSYQQEAG